MLDSFLKISYFHGKQYLWGMRVSGTASLIWMQSRAQSPVLCPLLPFTLAPACPWEWDILWAVQLCITPCLICLCFDYTGLVHIPHLGGFHRRPRVLIHGFSISAFCFCVVVSPAILSDFGGLSDVLTSWLSSMLFPLEVFISFPTGVCLGSYCPSMFFPFSGDLFCLMLSEFLLFLTLPFLVPVFLSPSLSSVGFRILLWALVLFINIVSGLSSDPFPLTLVWVVLFRIYLCSNIFNFWFSLPGVYKKEKSCLSFLWYNLEMFSVAQSKTGGGDRWEDLESSVCNNS